MKLDILKNIEKVAEKINVSDFIKQLTERLEIMEKELVIDRFEGKFAVCEDRESGKMYNIEINSLPRDVKEGNVIKLENGKYVMSKEKEEKIANEIKNKMEDLWN